MSPRARLGTWSGKSNPGFLGGDKRAQPTPRRFLSRGPGFANAEGSPPCSGFTGTFTENFDKADGALGPRLNWLNLTDDLDYLNFPGLIVASNQATIDPSPAVPPCVPPANRGSAVAAVLLVPDQVVSVTLSTCVPDSPAGELTGNIVALYARLTNPGNLLNCYRAIAFNVGGTGANEGTYFIQKIVSETLTGLFGTTTSATNFVQGDVLSFEVIGTSLDFKVNGSSVASGTDSSITGTEGDGTCSYAGFSLDQGCDSSAESVPSPDGTLLVDDFSVTATA